jgi:glycosyltransferase involved in cell wall biosynthesis
MNNSLVSVLIPVYNVETFVEEAIQSITSQTYQNLEIIVIDDASTDNTYKIIETLTKQDCRIKLYKNEKNLKIVKTLNRALTLATGEYIVRMDGDDISIPDKVEKQLAFLKNNPNIDLVGSHIVFIDQYGNEIKRTTMATSCESCKNIASIAIPILHIWMCKKRVYDTLSGYRELPGAEDYDFLLRMLSKNMKITNLDEFLYKVRLRDGNTVSSIGRKQIKIANYALQLYKTRTEYGIDDFTNENFIKATNTSQIAEKTYAFSLKLLKEAQAHLKNNELFRMIFKSCISLIISPFLIFELIKKRRVKNLVEQSINKVKK